MKLSEEIKDKIKQLEKIDWSYRDQDGNWNPNERHIGSLQWVLSELEKMNCKNCKYEYRCRIESFVNYCSEFEESK